METGAGSPQQVASYLRQAGSALGAAHSIACGVCVSVCVCVCV